MTNKKDINFTAFDFETATTDGMACQLGIVIVRRGVIQEKRCWMIRPPENRYDWAAKRVHHITEDDTTDSPTFLDLWPSIKPYLERQVLVGHNVTFDRFVLYKNMEAYGIGEGDLQDVEFECTYRIYGVDLGKLCEQCGMDKSQHHDALFDAECCARLYINYLLDGGDKNLGAVLSGRRKMDQMYHTQLRGDVLEKDLSTADPSSPFYDKKVVITGVFCFAEREDIAYALKRMGADIDKSLGKKTQIVCVGENPGPKKMEKIQQMIEDGKDIRIIYEDELESMIRLE